MVHSPITFRLGTRMVCQRKSARIAGLQQDGAHQQLTRNLQFTVRFN